MIELRWITRNTGIEYERVLQYRVSQVYMDAGGALNASGGQWTEWQDVPDAGLES